MWIDWRKEMAMKFASCFVFVVGIFLVTFNWLIMMIKNFNGGTAEVLDVYNLLFSTAFIIVSIGIKVVWGK